MLTIIIKGDEVFDESTSTFGTINDIVLQMEHSLVSLSKWESKHGKAFLAESTVKQMTEEETFSYLKAMVITPDVDQNLVHRLSQQNVDTIYKYIDSTQSATTFGEMPDTPGSGETITSELIYYWMVAFNIPFECQYWHLNRLFALIRICNIKNSKQKPLSRTQIAMRNAQINAKRRAELGTSG